MIKVLGGALAILLLFVTTVSAQSQMSRDRYALVIGNANFERARVLLNPANDARDVADRLAELGFMIHGDGAHVDLGRADMLSVMRDFAASVPDNAVALVFFAGHGLSQSGDTFLIPADDANLHSRADLASQAVALRELTGRLAARRGVQSFVLIDACSANGLRGEGLGAGGAGDLVASQDGSLSLAYAAAPGQIADDGQGRNSPFTLALLASLDDPVRRVDALFYDISARVRTQTGGHQIPWMAQTLATDLPPFLVSPQTETILQ